MANGTIKVSSRLPNGTEENFTVALDGKSRGTVKYPNGTIVETIKAMKKDVFVLYADGVKEHINIDFKHEFRQTTTITQYPDPYRVRRQKIKKKVDDDTWGGHSEYCCA
jgi:hypothetical protein